jgi:hypothetical protein
VAAARNPRGTGLWRLTEDGQLHPSGDAPVLPAVRVPVGDAVVTLAAVRDDACWVATAAGRVISVGGAAIHGDLAEFSLAAPIRAIVPTKYAFGYWLVGEDGGVFCFGDADFWGSAGDVGLAPPVVAGDRSRSGLGYWMMNASGDVARFGDARFDFAPLEPALRGRAVSAAAVPLHEDPDRSE